MAGLIKPKKYDWKDSNLALFGSDTEKKVKNEKSVETAVKKDSADLEPAWKGAGTEVSLKIWRIVNFKVEDWPKELYGKFYNGDSYIILNTYKPDPNGNELAYDLHFWIGANSTQDEYGTAAYKTVELDTYLEDKPVQHREVEANESDLFLSYFPNGMMLLEGGADTGFHHVEPEKYTPRLLHFSGQGKNVVVVEVPAAKTRLNSGDVFILDMGLTIYQWNGTGASAFEKNKAVQFINNIKHERTGKKIDVQVLDESSLYDEHPFYKALTAPDQKDDFHAKPVDDKPHLFRVSDAGGKLSFTDVKSGAVHKADFDSNDVFILDTPKSCFVWVGKGASPDERKNGFGYAHNHLMTTANPLRPIAVVKEGQENKDFLTAVAA
jgi:gelsolin